MTTQAPPLEVPAGVFAKIDAYVDELAHVVLQELGAGNGPSAVRADFARRTLVDLRNRLGSRAPDNSLALLRVQPPDPPVGEGELRVAFARLERIKNAAVAMHAALLGGGGYYLARGELGDALADRTSNLDDVARRRELDFGRKAPGRDLEREEQRAKRIESSARLVVKAASLRADDPLESEHSVLALALQD